MAGNKLNKNKSFRNHAALLSSQVDGLERVS